MLNKQLENCADFCMLVWLHVCLCVMMCYSAVLVLDPYPEYCNGQNNFKLQSKFSSFYLSTSAKLTNFYFDRSFHIYQIKYIVVIMQAFIKI